MRSKKLLVAAAGSALLLTGCQTVCETGLGPYQCAYLGNDYYRSGNFLKAKDYYEKGCQFDVGAACNNLGVFYQKGIGVPESDETAFKLFEKGCNSGNYGSAWACGNLGEAYFYGKGVKKSKEVALKLFEMASREDAASGYYGMGLIYEDGYKVKQSYAMAAQLYQKACDRNIGEACYKLGRLYEKGKGVTQSYLRAKELYSKACYGTYEKACERVTYINKKGLARKEEKAAEAQRRVAEAQRKPQSNATGNALAQIVDAVGQYQSQQIQHTQNMTQMYRNATRDLQTNTIQPMNFYRGPSVYRVQRINDNMGMIQQVR